MTQPFQSPVTVTIRPVNMIDVPALKASCWPNRSADAIAEFLQRAQKLRRYRRGMGVVAERGEDVCGYGMLTLWPRAAEISDLIVAQNHRDSGVGTSIIQYLTNAARDLNATMLEIGVAMSNPRAMALYRRLGFNDYRTIQLDLGSGPEAVLYLQKPLVTP